MRKLLVLIMTLVMSLSLVACSGGVDKKPLVDSFNAASASFDEVAKLVNENASRVSPQLIETMNKIADMLKKYKALAEGDEELTQEQVDEATKFLKTVPDSMAKMKASLEKDLANVSTSTGSVTKEQIDKVSAIVNKIAPLYNKALTDAEANGWTKDEVTDKELNTVYAIIQSASESLQDTTMFDGVKDMDAYIEQLQVISDAMPALLEKVSKPYSK